ncbi:MAG: NB-ARC domain-containing protein, partial [Kibdelosporangium sp.]
MGRPERPLDKTNGPIAAFAHDLRLLRSRAGNPSYRELARTALFAPSVLSSAASGHRLPTLAVTLAFVTACGGDRAVWERRWRGIAGQPNGVPGETRDNSADVASGSLFGGRQDGQFNSGQFDAEQFDGGQFDGGQPVTRPAQLPMGATTFVGRIRALTDAVRLIGAGGEVRTPLLVSGPIGVGKTAFALRLADEVCRDFPDGQLFADLGDGSRESRPGTNNSANSIVRGFLRALGVPAHLVPDDPTQRIGLYRSLLAQRRIFVLLANVRDEWQVRPLLARTAHSQVVMTSRARLLGLDGAHRVEMNAFTRAESLTLIGRLAGTARVRAEYEATDAIAELCGDLPLAVNIIGRKIAARQEWTIAYTAGQLADRDRLMVSLSVGDVTVRDRFASAYQRLSPPARQAVQHLGAGGAGWTTAIEVAAAMAVPIEAADELLESLVDAGLLVRATVAGRYTVSRLVSVFAADIRLDAVPAPLA